jgi:predicted MPP superfamily phosphohydrolase
VLKLRSSGRGGGFSVLRGMVEALQQAIFHGGWPGRLHDLRGVDVIVERLDVDARRAARPPLRLAFVSDVHIGPLTSPRLIEKAFDRLAALAPDVLVLGGDYVSYDVTAAGAELLAGLVGRVPSPTKVAVLGNHDLWTDHPMIERALEAGGARVLVNEAVRLPPPHDDVAIVGIDDPWTGVPDGERAFAAAGDAGTKIAVVHAPDGYPHVRDRGAALMLCGHTHGGQISTPYGAPLVPGAYGRRWPAGRFELDGMTLFVSRGIGTVDIPLRLFAPPDVALIHVK